MAGVARLWVIPLWGVTFWRLIVAGGITSGVNQPLEQQLRDYQTLT